MTIRNVVNIMLGRGKGGIEQAAVDYAEAMRTAGIGCLTITQPGAYINQTLDALQLPYKTLRAYGPWDIFAAYRLRRMLRAQNTTHVTTHGNRALSIAQLAGKRGHAYTLVAVAHNYKLRRYTKNIDAAFTITEDLAEHIRKIHPGINVTVIPNATHLPPERTRPPFRNPIVIGSMGRFVNKKGFDIFIEALAILKSRGKTFEAVLGGDGDQAPVLNALAEKHGLTGHLRFIGWVKDKQAFWDSIDIFVLPSHHEPFGIVLIEAMAQSLPCISTASEGPREILTSSLGTLTPLGDSLALASALASYIAYPETARAHGRGARAKVISTYTIEAMGERLASAL